MLELPMAGVQLQLLNTTQIRLFLKDLHKAEGKFEISYPCH